jgi:CBS domain-containing protein
MAALFAGASRALLASVVFAFETTGQQVGLLPLLAGCTVSYIISSYFMKNTIMTEKIARRGVTVPHEYAPDFLDGILAKRYCNRAIISLSDEESVGAVLAKFDAGAPEYSHQGYPITDANGHLIGVLTRRDFSKTSAEMKVKELVKRAPVIAFEDQSLRAVADLMTQESIGRVVVVARANPKVATGIITRSDLLSAHQSRLNQSKRSRNHSVPQPV